MTPDEAEIKELDLLRTLDRMHRQRLFYRIFPDEDTFDGPTDQMFHAREKYPKHMELIAAGAHYRERCFMAANRVGKTFAGAYEMTCHLTGLYPDWWAGRRFARPISAWAAGKTNETTRDIIQKNLLGQIKRGGGKGFDGTGVIPGETIGGITWKQGVSDLADTIKIKHATGGWSVLGLKSYQQGRGSFEGTAQHAIWLDEEPPEDIYGECLIRTATTGGIILLTFTPLEGRSKVVKSFLPGAMSAQT